MTRIRLAGLSVSFLEDGRVLVRAPALGIGARIPAMAVGLLAFCSQPRTREQAVRAFGPNGGTLFDGLGEAGLLVSPEEAAQTPVFFGNFASIDIHRRMLADAPRIDAYRRALDEVVGPDSVVIDAGTGSGVLACLAARAGARRVYAVDASDVVEHAAETVRRSGLQDVVEVLQADFATVQLPEKADVLVTETFGAFALAEGASGDLATCIANNLKDGATVVPDTLELWLAPVSDATVEAETLGAFRSVPGVDLSGLAEGALKRAITLPIRSESLAAPGQRLASVPWPTGVDRIEGRLVFEGLQAGTVFGLAGWWRARLSEGVWLGTGPEDPDTHWAQVFFPIEPASVAAGAAFEIDVHLTQAADDRRAAEMSWSWTAGVSAGRAFHRIR